MFKFAVSVCIFVFSFTWSFFSDLVFDSWNIFRLIQIIQENVTELQILEFQALRVPFRKIRDIFALVDFWLLI